jgi:hypothetical protein
MDENLISEPDFLMTELRYTLGQLTVQLGGVGSDVQADAPEVRDEIRPVLKRMLENEKSYQDQYARLLGISRPAAGAGTGTFTQLREQTIAMLKRAGENWPPELLACVKQQVAGDREATTQIAEARRAMLDHDQRPDLETPLTTEPHPGVEASRE